MYYISCFGFKRWFSFFVFLKIFFVHSNIRKKPTNKPIKIRYLIYNLYYLEKKKREGEKNKFAKQVNDFLK